MLFVLAEERRKKGWATDVISAAVRKVGQVGTYVYQ